MKCFIKRFKLQGREITEHEEVSATCDILASPKQCAPWMIMLVGIGSLGGSSQGLSYSLPARTNRCWRLHSKERSLFCGSALVVLMLIVCMCLRCIGLHVCLVCVSHLSSNPWWLLEGGTQARFTLVLRDGIHLSSATSRWHQYGSEVIVKKYRTRESIYRSANFDKWQMCVNQTRKYFCPGVVC